MHRFPALALLLVVGTCERAAPLEAPDEPRAHAPAALAPAAATATVAPVVTPATPEPAAVRPMSRLGPTWHREQARPRVTRRAP